MPAQKVGQGQVQGREIEPKPTFGQTLGFNALTGKQGFFSPSFPGERQNPLGRSKPLAGSPSGQGAGKFTILQGRGGNRVVNPSKMRIQQCNVKDPQQVVPWRIQLQYCVPPPCRPPQPGFINGQQFCQCASFGGQGHADAENDPRIPMASISVEAPSQSSHKSARNPLPLDLVSVSSASAPSP